MLKLLRKMRPRGGWSGHITDELTDAGKSGGPPAVMAARSRHLRWLVGLGSMPQALEEPRRPLLQRAGLIQARTRDGGQARGWGRPPCS